MPFFIANGLIMNKLVVEGSTKCVFTRNGRCMRSYKPLQAFIATEHGRCGYNVWKRDCGVSSIESTMLVTVKDK